jgi:hypothetical protein
MATDDFFRSRLDQMIDLRHPLAALTERIPWSQLEASLAPSFARRSREGKVIEGDDLFGSARQVAGGGTSSAGRPRLPIRLMAALLYLKHAFNLSDEELVARWSENVVWQYFSGLDYYTPKLPCDATQIGRFRTAIGEAGVEELLKATIDTAVQTKAVRPAEFERVIVDTTVQEKAIAHPVDSRLLEIARAKVVQAAKQVGLTLKQTFVKEGKELRRKAGGYAHAKQFKRLRRTVKRQRTILGIVLREVRRKLTTVSSDCADGHRPSEHTARTRRTHPHATNPRQEQALRPACPRSRVHQQRQSPQALRVRRQGQHRRHPQERPGGRRPHLPRQSLRRSHSLGTTGADPHPARRHRQITQSRSSSIWDTAGSIATIRALKSFTAASTSR